MQIRSLHFLFYIVFTGISSYCTSAFTLPETHQGHDTSEKATVVADRPLPQRIRPPAGYVNSVEMQVRTTDGRPGPEYWQQFAVYDLEVALHPEEKRISGIARITYFNKSPETLYQLHLELVQNLHAEGAIRNRVAEVTGGMQLNQVSVQGMNLGNNPESGYYYSVNGTRMIIHPPTPLVPGDQLALEIEYEFKIPQSGAGGRMGHHGDNLFHLAYWYPQMVVFDDVVGWHPDPYRGQAEFYHGFADYNLTIHAPEQWLIMATGELQNAADVLAPYVMQRWNEAKQSDEPKRVYTAGGGEATVRTASDNGLLTWHFSARNVRDVAFSAMLESNWEVARTPVGNQAGGITGDYTVINAFWRDSAPLWQEIVAYQQHAITFLSDITGIPYPWPHMTAVEGGGIIEYGMEFPMMTLMGDYNEHNAETLYLITAHELAHMWIPLIVSTDERRYSWLDEGNTVFKTAEAIMDFQTGRMPHLDEQRVYLNIARSGEEGPLMRWSDFHYTLNQFIIASYNKPSTILVALRKVLGEDVFWKAYREFISEWAYKHAYPWDFFRTFERVSGRDLDWFWYSWYYETWVLNQAVEKVSETNEGTRIVIKDKGEIPMPVYLTVTFDGGHNIDYEIPADAWLAGSRTTEITIPELNVSRVEIDSGHELPDINRKNMIWQR